MVSNCVDYVGQSGNHRAPVHFNRICGGGADAKSSSFLRAVFYGVACDGVSKPASIRLFAKGPIYYL